MGTEIKIDIFGSCVSRDAIEYQVQKMIAVNNYIARQSLVSAVSKPIEINENELGLDSAFQKRMVLHDFRKDTFQVLKENKGDCLMIDLVEERFPLAYVNGSYVTYSNELALSEYIHAPQIVRCFKKQYCRLVNLIFRKEKWMIEQNDIGAYIQMFCNKIQEIYRQEEIIIHEVYLQNQYLTRENQIMYFDENTMGYNDRINDYYRYLYHSLKKRMPHAYHISLSDKYYADEKNRWGLASMHFESRYYKEVIKDIINYLAIGIQ